MPTQSSMLFIRRTTVAVIALSLFGFSEQANAQRKKKEARYATVQGVIKNDARKSFRVGYDEIKTSLRKVVVPKTPPFPSNWKTMIEEDRKQWLSKFYESDQGKDFLKSQEKLINGAATFEVKYNDDGDFIVYDVPPGEYGLQGRIDKEIDGITYGFEVFARIKVLDDVDQIKLQPIPVTITPLFKEGQPAPGLDGLLTSKGQKLSYDLDAYKGCYIFLNFMNSTDQAPGYQKQVQDMYKALREKHKVKLISIVMDNADKDGKKGKGKTDAINWLVNKQFTEGSYGFTGGWDHKTIEAYGVRSTPSGWLISPDEDRKILMTQHEFFRLARIKPTITAIVRDRITGKDTPTLATKPEDREKLDDKEKSEEEKK